MIQLYTAGQHRRDRATADRLRAALRRRAASEGALGASGAIDEKPRTAHELVTRRMVDELRDDLAELKSRVNGLIWAVVGAGVLQIVLRLLGS